MAKTIRTAFVLGAGLGTRLKELTALRPKPLIPVCQKPLITFAFDHLIRCGIERLVINTHHCPEVYAEVFPEAIYRGVPLVFRHEPVLLETAGGIGNVADLLGDEPFLVCNGDILTDLPVDWLIARHLESGNEVTLALRSFGGPAHISLDLDSDRIVDIRNMLGSGAAQEYLFTGVYAVSPDFLRRIPRGEKVSVVPIFLEMIRAGAGLGGVVIDDGRWFDLGTREEYLNVHRSLKRDAGAFWAHETSPVWVHPTARVASTAEVLGATVIGAGATVGEGARLRDCILWEGAKVEPESVLDNCIVTADRTVGGVHSGGDF